MKIKLVGQTIRFALKNAFRKKLVAVLSITGIAIGIALMVALSSASAGFDNLLGDAVAETVGDVDVQEYNKELTLSQLPVNISEIIRTIDSNDKIMALSPEVVVSNFLQFADNVTIELGAMVPPGPLGLSETYYGRERKGSGALRLHPVRSPDNGKRRG